MPDKALAESLSRLYRLHASGIKFGLDTERALLAQLGNPEKNLQIIHVAGTNGKGSVCAMLESGLRAAGLKTGLYTSPHLIHFNERIRVNGNCIRDNQLSGLIRHVDSSAQRIIHDSNIMEVTFFEFATAMAFEHFSREKVDIAVIETGMGGRLDATNVITPLLSVITGISLEHISWLGTNVASIAREKCGIIKPGIPVITGTMDREAFDVVGNTCAELRSPLIQAGQAVSIQRKRQNLHGQKITIESAANSYGTIMLPLLGPKALENTAITVATLEEIASVTTLKLPPDVIKQGLEQVCWPGRFHILSENPPVILDAAHNPEAAEALSMTLKELLKGIPIGLVLGMCDDKDIHGFLRPLANLVKTCWAVPLNNTKRGLATQKISLSTRAMGWQTSESTVSSAFAQAKTWAKANHGAVCVAGSIFLVGEVLELKTKGAL